jgi:hypothetical protein
VGGIAGARATAKPPARGIERYQVFVLQLQRSQHFRVFRTGEFGIIGVVRSLKIRGRIARCHCCSPQRAPFDKSVPDRPLSAFLELEKITVIRAPPAIF